MVWTLELWFWILDFGFWGLDFGVLILECGFWIFVFFWILGFGLELGWKVPAIFSRSWMWDFGVFCLDPGFWIWARCWKGPANFSRSWKWDCGFFFDPGFWTWARCWKSASNDHTKTRIDYHDIFWTQTRCQTQKSIFEKHLYTSVIFSASGCEKVKSCRWQALKPFRFTDYGAESSRKVHRMWWARWQTLLWPNPWSLEALGIRMV